MLKFRAIIVNLNWIYEFSIKSCKCSEWWKWWGRIRLLINLQWENGFKFTWKDVNFMYILYIIIKLSSALFKWSKFFYINNMFDNFWIDDLLLLL